MASKRDFYEVLGVSREASAEEIKRAYKKMALENHPDRNPGDDGAVNRFKEASEAFEVLRDPEKRTRYDRYGHAGVAGGNGGSPFADVGDIFDAFGDIFEGFGFFGGGGPRRGARARRGNSLRTALTIDLHEAAAGCTKTLDVERQELCDTCGGSGAKPGTTPQTCDYCRGQGRVVQSQGFFRIQTTCPACHGDGRIVRDRCADCHGSGRTMKSTRMEVKVPPGVDNGMQLCLRGEGEPGSHSGPRGDLYVDILVREHPLFERHERNLMCRVPITFSQASLGTTLDVPLLDGRQELVVPAGTQPGKVFEIRGKGMPDPHGRRRGDLLVEVQLEVPRELTPRQEELIREMAELEHANVTPHRQSFFEKVKAYFTAAEGEESEG